MGVKQWIFQRISNALLVAFGLWLIFTVVSGGLNQAFIQSAFSGTYSSAFLIAVLVLGGLNAILAGWQIAGDYAHKFGVNQNLVVGICAVVSIAYIAMGLRFF